MAKKFCFTCGGQYNRNYLTVPCPECNALYGNVVEIEEEKQIVMTEEAMEEIKDKKIPDHFLKKKWDKEKFVKSHPEDRSILEFQNYVNSLNKFNAIFERGSIPGGSTIIISPERYGKQVTVYSCMQLAAANGYSVAPFLDSCELKTLFISASEKGNLKAMNKIEQIMESDVCFLSVTHLHTRKNSYEVILELVNRRARKDKATFIVSHYPVREITEWDDYGRFDGVIDGEFDIDIYVKRYLMRLEYKHKREGDN